MNCKLASAHPGAPAGQGKRWYICEHCEELYARRPDTAKASISRGIPQCCSRACLLKEKSRLAAGDAPPGTMTAEMVRSLFDYDPISGSLVWRSVVGNRAVVGAEAGYVNASGYRVVQFRKVNWYVHRLIWLYAHGEMPVVIDHIDHDKLNNRLSNLRNVTRRENCRNQSLSRRNKSGTIGVFWSRIDRMWVAQIWQNNKPTHLGMFKKKSDAVKVRQDAERALNYHPNHGKPHEICGQTWLDRGSPVCRCERKEED